MWSPKPHQVLDIGNDYFVINFSSTKDYNRALFGGPWTILGHYLTVQSWSSDLDSLSNSSTCTIARFYVQLVRLLVRWSGLMKTLAPFNVADLHELL